MTTKTKQPLGPNQQAWVDALRSGDFKQAKGHLETTEGLCCLGVACAINNKFADRHPINNMLFGLDLATQEPILNLLRLKQSNGAFNPFGINKQVVQSLTQLNDGLEWNFNQIADFIEEHADELFHEPA